MMPFEYLYNHLFGQTGQDNIVALDKIVEEYPYFGLAHFFLLQQSKMNGAVSPSVMARTSLHFNNALLLNYQLNYVSSPESAEVAVLAVPNNQKVEEQSSGEYLHGILAETGDTAVQEEPKSLTHDNLISTIDPVIPYGMIAVPALPVQEEAADPERKEEELLFEPLHTTDYFASQGIKISEEAQPTDKLGMQLKSFTQWLKTMKKVHESKLPEGSDHLDASVNRLAEKSNLETEVVTEAMAEAFIVQGKPQKAKDIYSKLSLLNPSKNAYFAAKLEQLK